MVYPLSNVSILKLANLKETVCEYMVSDRQLEYMYVDHFKVATLFCLWLSCSNPNTWWQMTWASTVALVTDIVEGNLKATMRLILALAAHFKPGSVKQPQPQPQGLVALRNKVTRTPSAAAAAAEAAAAIGEASRAAASVGRHMNAPYRHR